MKVSTFSSNQDLKVSHIKIAILDENRFGTKLMLKMGWSKGKGLGRDEAGSKDFLRVRFKNDVKGIGFENRDDQWTQHEQSFNGLLSTLNGEEENASFNDDVKQIFRDESEDETPRLGFGCQNTAVSKKEVKSKSEKVTKLKEKISGVSLEEKSKKSKARVHYKKFTRGKDLSQYSEKDLANIFGKKIDEVSNNVDIQQEEDISNGGTDDLDNNSHFLHTGVSVSDYFKKKMEERKKRFENGTPTSEMASGAEYHNDSHQAQEEKVSGKKRKENNSEEEENNEIPTKKEKKSKKNKKLHQENENFETDSPSANTESISAEEGIEEHKCRKNKKKLKNKIKEDSHQEEQTDSNTINTETLESVEKEQKSKKNKKSKNKSEMSAPQAEELVQAEESNMKRKKKKKYSVDKVCENTEVTANTIVEIDLTDEPQEKKRKKNKNKENKSNNADENEEIKANTEELQTPVEKKKRKSKNKKQSADHQEDPPETKAKDVSSNADSILTKNVNIDKLEPKDIKKLRNAYNIYQISSFCAEKFRNTNLNDFNGSTLPQIDGYGFHKDVQMDVELDKNDEERITNLWHCVLNKYDHLQKPKKTYKQYVKEVRKARKMKQKLPKLYIKTWKRKNAFQIV